MISGVASTTSQQMQKMCKVCLYELFISPYTTNHVSGNQAAAWLHLRCNTAKTIECSKFQSI